MVGGYNLTLPIAYNTKVVSAQEAPKTWEDLADPKWKGRKIIIEARLVPFAMLGTEWGKGKAVELTKKILSQQPLIVQGGTTVANALAGGQVSIAVGTYAFTIERFEKAGRCGGLGSGFAFARPEFGEGSAQNRSASQCRPVFCRLDRNPRGPEDRYASTGQAMEVGKNAIGTVAERIRSGKPAIILETEKNFGNILEIQRELGKMLGALR